nr:SusD/RagB family nutrient-binding outer membrane lipoprotein [uncultured Allomuricauda sp.]
MKLYRNILGAMMSGILMLSSCETTDLDLTNNPNDLVPEQANVDFFINSIQEDFVRQFEGDADNDINDNWASGGNTDGDGLNELGMEITRIVNMNGRNYASVYQASDVDDEWDNCYRGIIADIRAMTPLAEESGQIHHIGIAQFIEAYLMITMVDFFGDVPYSEIIQAREGVFNPGLDAGADIYEAALSLIDEAIASFNADALNDPGVDFYYGNDYDKWITAANTLKMKIYLQRRLVDANAITSFNGIISGGNYIQDTADDFQWNWPGTNASQPDVRHPRYGLNYTAGGANEYMSTWLMNLLDTTNDPRTRYYFYRQNTNVPGAEISPDEELLSCSLESPPQHYIDGNFTFCWLDNGYWGRDHGDTDGIPPDGLRRAVYGSYPVGGRFDDDSFEAVSATAGSGGNGITNLLTAFGVDFMRAEIAMVNGDETAAEGFLLAAFDKSVAKVQNFLVGREAGADTSFEPSPADITAYRGALQSNFQNADTEGKWDILGEQFFIAHFGNGVETYNFYRRTGYPTTLQPNLEPDPGSVIRSLYYPSDAVNNNSSISQKASHTEPVFWDTNNSPIAN